MKKHLGSTIALVLGVLSFLGGVSQAVQPTGAPQQGDLLTAGLVLTLGALAYRSCKKRKLGEVRSSVFRQGLEIAALIAAVLLVILQNNLKERLVLDPVPNVLFPLGAILAYAFVALKKFPQPQNSQDHGVAP